MIQEFPKWLRNIFPKIPRYYNHLQINGIKNLPKQGSAIICPNHSGGMNYDSLCLMSLFDHFNTSDPSRKRIWLCFWDLWVFKKEPWATILQQFSPIPISLTGGGIPYDLVDKIVEQGELIAIMPEGRAASLQEGYNLWKFYPGVIKLHLRYEIPIIPTAMIGFGKACPIYSVRFNPDKIPPWENEVMLPIIFPKQLKIRFGSPIYFPDYYNKDLKKDQLFHLAQKVKGDVEKVISVYKKNVSSKNSYGTD